MLNKSCILQLYSLVVVVIVMVGYDPVVKYVEEEGSGEDDDGHQVKKPRIPQNHLQSVSDSRILL